MPEANPNPRSLERIVSHPWWQLLIGIAALAAIPLAIFLHDDLRHWLVSTFSRNELPIVAGLLLLAISSAALLLISNRRRNRRHPTVSAKPDNGEAEIAAKIIGDRVPGGHALVEYLRSTLFINGRLKLLRSLDTDHYLSAYEKNFRLDGHDIWTYERYTVQNISRNPTTRLLLPTVGGSSLRAEELEANVYQVQDGNRHLLRLTSAVDGERFKLLEAHYATALQPGSTTQLDFQECWPRAMTDGIDAVFYTQTLYYAKGIGALTSRIEFDRQLLMIGAWWYDFDSHVCEPDETALTVDEKEPTGPVYSWRVANPSASRLYFVVFDRPQPGSDT